ncbi:MAG TPA: response regulator [Thermodesulfovibrionales bacterium]|nr:response regulator [Thermodesulfovibrionales bacterium]
MKVLIVDDTMSNVILFRELVKRIEGCEPVCFTEPTLALSWCEQNDPDLVLVDYMMPNLNGIDFIRRFREFPDKEATPLIVITAYGEKDVLYMALNQGANDFLTKPIDRTEFASRVKNMLRLRKVRNDLAARTEELTQNMDELSTRMLSMEQEHSRVEGELRHMQKIDTIGRLAGGVAHDFNNILSAILVYGTMIKNRLNSDSPLRTYADKLLASSERAGVLTKSLLSFSRKKESGQDMMLCDLNAVISEAAEVLIRPVCKGINISLRLSDGPLPVMASSSEIEQVLLNLAVNARDAMHDQGTVIIRTSTVFEDVLSDQGLKNYALVTVSDTGTGMDESTKKRIFEPFFTTKGDGAGTGLGLSIVDEIIASHHGHIKIDSEIGKGTSFLIYIPMAHAAEAHGGHAA